MVLARETEWRLNIMERKMLRGIPGYVIRVAANTQLLHICRGVDKSSKSPICDDTAMKSDSVFTTGPYLGIFGRIRSDHVPEFEICSLSVDHEC